jgi:signal transduction histidine kinase
MIEDVRRSDRDNPASCNLTDVVNQRMGFWQVVSAAQDRHVTIMCPDDPIPVGVAAADVLAVLDNLVQNVLTHTEAGVAFTVAVTANPPSLTVIDEGEGLASPTAFTRGASGGGSSGLGLDIVRQISEGSGGDVKLGSGPGTTITVAFGPADGPDGAS